MAVTFKDGVVVGADSRTTTGSYIGAKRPNISQQSYRQADAAARPHILLQIGVCGGYTGSCRHNSVLSFSIRVIDFITTSIQEEKLPNVKTAASLFQRLIYSNKDSLMAGIIIGGWDPVDGPSVYSIPLGGSLHKRPFAIGGSGSTFIYGYCDAMYKEGMTRDQCIEFTKNGFEK